MPNVRAKNTVRYYLILILFLSFLFFSNDFGLIDVQKTAIVIAVGIDREDEGFIITSQIAVPQSSQQGKSSEAVQLVSRGKTVAAAFEQINGKTGWYPKLVFCKLLLFGEKAAQENVFDALDFFLREEYLTDDCLVAVCRNTAQALLNTTALVDSSSSSAISKVLSAHAARTGSVYTSNLKDFSIGYFGDSQSGLLPVLKQEAQQEKSPQGSGNGGREEGGSSESGSSASSSGEGSSAQSGAKGQGKSGEDKPVFSARETALFVRGVWRETLTADETFALSAATGKLRLASYSVETNDGACTLTVKRNLPKIGLDVGKDGRGAVQVKISMIAGVRDYAKAQSLEEVKDIGSIPDGVFAAAEKKLSAALITAYEKARGVGCDVLELEERLVKYKKRQYLQHKESLLSNTAITVRVRFQSVR